MYFKVAKLQGGWTALHCTVYNTTLRYIGNMMWEPNVNYLYS